MEVRPCINCGYTHNTDKPKLGEEIMHHERFTLAGPSRDILLRLIQADGAIVSFDELIHFVYGDRKDGGPVSAKNAIACYTSRLRNEIARYGYIVGSAQLIGYWLSKVPNDGTSDTPVQLLTRQARSSVHGVPD